jgi:hypothetical protein
MGVVESNELLRRGKLTACRIENHLIPTTDRGSSAFARDDRSLVGVRLPRPLSKT